ncbi:MAG: nucleotidyltransferase family protein, partial [Firmicutes bacterium]|nr:nucleotidyltransferase family protein [Bacillota bacterium]
MSVAGIIAEFDPFHNGHRYLIDTVRRELSPRAVVCVMSGQFTQRGEPAILDKFVRAELAVHGGADLVVELPVCCAVNAAREFAFGGCRTLSLLGVVTHLCFGSETGDLALLEKTAELALKEDEPFRKALKGQLEAGRPYGTAYIRAMRAVLGPEIADFPHFPASNDILALEYLKQLKQADFGLVPHAVKRVGAAHKNGEITEYYSSGESIRMSLHYEGVLEDIRDEVPPYTYEALENYSFLPDMEEKMLDMLRYAVTEMSPAAIAQAPGVSEGLENVIRKEIRKARSYADLVERIRSKRYPESRVCRILTQILLGITGNDLPNLLQQPAYVRVLAVNETGAGLISEAREKGAARIVVNPGKEDWGKEGAPSNLLLDMRASEVYGMVCGRTPYNSSDLVN